VKGKAIPFRGKVGFIAAWVEDVCCVGGYIPKDKVCR
jgi:hypothetical protein